MDMRRVFLLFVLTFLTATRSVVGAQEEELTVADKENSGCLSNTRGARSELLPTIVLTKEGSILSVQVLNYSSNCGTVDFSVTSAVSGGREGAPCSVTVNVVPVIPADKDCTCTFNVSFTVRDIAADTFHLRCWWYDGVVSLTEGEPLVLEDITEYAVIDDQRYMLKKTLGKAMLTNVTTRMSEFRIPAELNYEGHIYTVTKILSGAFYYCTSLKTIDIPESVSMIDGGVFFGCILNTLYIRGTLEPRYISKDFFRGMGTQPEVYVQPSEVERYKAVYDGPVYPLPQTGQPNSIDDIGSASAQPASSVLFDLQGRRLTSPPAKGVYIRDGKKVVIK